MDLRRADLHMHTRCSDGRLSPSELIRHARDSGLHAIAITDHDCVDGLDEAVAVGERLGVQVVPGIEMSVTVGLREAHLLGFFFDPTEPQLVAHLQKYRDIRERRVQGIVNRLGELGVPVTIEDVLDIADGAVLGRPHIAAAVVRNNHAASEQDVFDAYLKEGAPGYVPKPPFPAEDALDMLHRAGGIGVLAHPGHWTSDAAVKHLVRSGLDGLETVHPSHDYGLRQYYRSMVRDYGLIETGGSDYHGFRNVDEENLGRFSVPFAQLESIEDRAVRVRATSISAQG